jgi:hypothetical protein
VQVVGHIGHGLPFDARLAVADNGRAALVWARSPQLSGTAIELATAKPGARFSRPETIAHVPFGVIHMALGISNSGEVIVALAPESPGGIEVVMRSGKGSVRPPQWIVRPPVPVFEAPSLAVEADGTALLAWSASSRGNQGGATTIGAAWREHGRARFGGSLSLGSLRFSSPPRALFVAPDRGVIGLAGGSTPGPSGGIFTAAEVAFAGVGGPFGAPVVLSNPAGPDAFGIRLAPDGEGGVFATWMTGETLPLVAGGSLWTTHVTSGGQQQPAQQFAGGNLTPASLSAAGQDHAIAVWDVNQRGIEGAQLGPGRASSFTNGLREQRSVAPSVAADGAGAGVVVWPQAIKAPSLANELGLHEIRYATIPPGAHAFCPARAVGTSTEDPQLAVGRSGGFILRIGTRSAGGPIEVARWNAVIADARRCP